MTSTIAAAIPHFFDPSPATPASRFAPFHIYTFTYKTVQNHPIEVSLLLPRAQLSRPRKAPILVHWHGGALVTGSRLYPEWFAQWQLDLAEHHGAIVLSPDHRLLPEASGADILEDVGDFWMWVKTGLRAALDSVPDQDGLEPDLERVLVVGESAGGWLAVQSGLLFGHIVPVRCVVTQYGQLAMRERWLPDGAAPEFPSELLDRQLEMVRMGLAPRVVSAALPPSSRFPVMFSMMQSHRFPEVLGTEQRLYPIESLEIVGKGKVPPTWVLHGKADNLTPPKGSVDFVEEVKRSHSEADVLFSLLEGGHNLDADMHLDEECLQPGIAFVTKHWIETQ